MIYKILEVRDEGTHIPVIAVKPPLPKGRGFPQLEADFPARHGECF
jgi:hypothetical protein